MADDLVMTAADHRALEAELHELETNARRGDRRADPGRPRVGRPEGERGVPRREELPGDAGDEDPAPARSAAARRGGRHAGRPRDGRPRRARSSSVDRRHRAASCATRSPPPWTPTPRRGGSPSTPPSAACSSARGPATWWRCPRRRARARSRSSRSPERGRSRDRERCAANCAGEGGGRESARGGCASRRWPGHSTRLEVARARLTRVASAVGDVAPARGRAAPRRRPGRRARAATRRAARRSARRRRGCAPGPSRR